MSRLHVRLLGVLALEYDTQPVLGVTSARLQSLLAYLILHREAPQPREHLAWLLWPDSSESQASTNLRKALHVLRTTLPDAVHFIHSDAHSIQWRPDRPYSLDVDEFEAAISRGQEAIREGKIQAAKDDLERAIACYKGDLLLDCYDEWLVPFREKMRHTYLETLEQLAAVCEQAGDYANAIGYVQREVAEEPLHEAAYRSLMHLYLASGNRAEALRVYQTCAAVLHRELGVEPGSATHDMYVSALNKMAPSASSCTGTRADEWVRATTSCPNLPIPLTSFIGREREIGEICCSLDEVRLLTLLGVGGSGKTRLALEVAHVVARDYPDGVGWVDLVQLQDAALVPHTVAAALSLQEKRGESATETLQGGVSS